MESLVNIHEMEQLRKYYSNSYDEKSINKIKDFYFHERYLNCETTRLEQICHLYGDINFIKDFHRGLHNFLEQNDAPVYNYEFKFDGDFNMLKNLLFLTRPLLRQSLKGACHADELFYLFYSPQLGTFSKVNSPEFRMCRTICKLWCNFAKTGNPNSQDFSFTWKNTSKDNPNYLSLDGDNTCMVNELLCGVRVDLWDTISE